MQKDIDFLRPARGMRGFSLIELMIAVFIVTTIATFALPAYQKYVLRENRASVQAVLVQIAQRLSAYKSVNNDYNTTLANGAIYGGTAVYPQSGKALYTLKLDTTTVAGGWTLSATPTAGTSQSKDGAVFLNELGYRCWKKAGTSCTPSSTSDWANGNSS